MDVGDVRVERRVGLLEVEQTAVDIELHARDGGEDTGDAELTAHLDVEQEVRVDVAAIFELELGLTADQVVAQRVALEDVDAVLVGLQFRGPRVDI